MDHVINKYLSKSSFSWYVAMYDDEPDITKATKKLDKQKTSYPLYNYHYVYLYQPKWGNNVLYSYNKYLPSSTPPYALNVIPKFWDTITFVKFDIIRFSEWPTCPHYDTHVFISKYDVRDFKKYKGKYLYDILKEWVDTIPILPPTFEENQKIILKRAEEEEAKEKEKRAEEEGAKEKEKKS